MLNKIQNPTYPIYYKNSTFCVKRINSKKSIWVDHYNKTTIDISYNLSLMENDYFFNTLRMEPTAEQIFIEAFNEVSEVINNTVING